MKCLGWSAKELRETQYWLLLIVKRGYVKTSRLEPLLQETGELLAIVKTMIARVRQKQNKPKD